MTTTTTMLPPPPPPGPMPPPLDNVVITTPAQPPPLEQRMAFAALHTAGSGPSLYSQTEFSSLGASNRSPDGFTPHTPQRHEQPMDVDDDSDDEDIAPVQRQRQDRSTRSTSTVLGNDFDRDDTDDEAGFEVDFSDNFWTAPPTTIPTSERVARGEYGDDHDPPPPDATSDQEDDDDDEATTFSHHTNLAVDLGRLLQECSQFDFEEIKTNEELEELQATMTDTPGKVYEGESGWFEERGGVQLRHPTRGLP